MNCKLLYRLLAFMLLLLLLPALARQAGRKRWQLHLIDPPEPETVGGTTDTVLSGQ